MPTELLLPIAAAKAALLLGAALLIALGAVRATAAMRHAVLIAGMAGALAVPLLSATLPPLAPAAVREAHASVSSVQPRWADNALLLLMTRSDAASEVPVRSTLRGALERWGVWVLLVWSAGTIVVLVRIAADVAAARRVVARSRVHAWIRPRVPLLESADIGAPLAVGIFRPAILIPEAAALGTGDRGLVIQHELAHVERRDCLTQLIARVTCALYWFNPLVWWAARRIALERERACDDRVLASGVDPIAYAQLLVDVARRGVAMAGRPHALPSMARQLHLETRIAGILASRAARSGLPRARTMALAIVACFVIVPVAAFGVHDGPAPGDGSDPWQDPGSERVAGIPEAGPPAASGDLTSPDGLLIETLRRAAGREPAHPYDLVPDRARWALSRVRGGNLIEPLKEALRHPDWQVRSYAAWALGVSGDPGAVDLLIPLMDDPVWRLRAMSASVLRQTGGPRAAPALATALRDPAWQVRVEAVAYFGMLRDPRFEDLIRPLQGDPHIAVRLAVGEALDSM